MLQTFNEDVIPKFNLKKIKEKDLLAENKYIVTVNVLYSIYRRCVRKYAKIGRFTPIINKEDFVRLIYSINNAYCLEIYKGRFVRLPELGTFSLCKYFRQETNSLNYYLRFQKNARLVGTIALKAQNIEHSEFNQDFKKLFQENLAIRNSISVRTFTKSITISKGGEQMTFTSADNIAKRMGVQAVSDMILANKNEKLYKGCEIFIERVPYPTKFYGDLPPKIWFILNKKKANELRKYRNSNGESNKNDGFK